MGQLTLEAAVLPEMRVEVVETEKEFSALTREVEKHREACLDTETVGHESKRLFEQADGFVDAIAELSNRYDDLHEDYQGHYKGKRSPEAKEAKLLVEGVESQLKQLITEQKDLRTAGVNHRGGLHFWENELGALQVGVRPTNKLINCYVIRPGCIDLPWLMGWLERLQTLILQSCQFDWRMLKQHLGIELDCSKLYDTKIAEYCLHNGEPGFSKTSLGAMALRHLGLALDKSDALRVSNWAGDWSPNMSEYAALDVFIPFLLRDKQMALFQDRPRQWENFRLQCELVPHVARMEMVGLGLDLEGAKAMLEERLEKRKDAQAALVSQLSTNNSNPLAIGLPHFNEEEQRLSLNSQAQMKGMLNCKDGVREPIKDTDKKTLRKLAKQVPELTSALIDYREQNKLITTYLQPFVDQASYVPHRNKSGGYYRIFANLNPHQTATNRFSSDDPNLQNLPVKDFRRLIIPKPGWCFIQGDLSSIEPRILAHITQDPVMLRAFHDGLDPYKHTASILFRKRYKDITQQERKNIKAVALGISYLKTPFGLAADLEISVSQAMELMKRYFAIHMFTKRWMDDTLAQARIDGYVETLDGFRRYLPDINSPDKLKRETSERQAINTTIQGTAASCMKRSIIWAGRLLTKEEYRLLRMVLTVHDELILEAKDNVHQQRLGKALLKQALIQGTEELITTVPIKIGSEETKWGPTVGYTWEEFKVA